MKAIVQSKFGAADVLELGEVATPTIGDDKVLIRVHAASVHIGDWHLMTGQPYVMRVMEPGFRKPKVRGMDVAGVVEAAGRGVTRFRVGDEVFGVCDGAFAEYAAAREDKLAPKPVNLTFEQAAAVPTSACTAVQALRDAGGVKPGGRVLIVGASGGVGIFAVQIAKALGANVTGVCSAAKSKLVRSLGADQVIDYAREDFTKNGQRYDLILDMAGNQPLARLRRVLTRRGTLVLVGGEAGGPWIGVIGRFVGALVQSPFVSQRQRPLIGVTNANDLQFLKELIEAARVAPVIDRLYPLDETARAMGYLATGQARGKIGITVQQPPTAPLLAEPQVAVIN